MKVHLVNLGCARNTIDGELMMGLLEREGLELTDEAGEAGAIVVNTCSFIEAAAEESIDTILALAEHKRTGLCRRLVVTGCLPERYREDIRASLPEVDVFLGTAAYDRIAEAVRDGGGAEADRFPDPDRRDAAFESGKRRVTTGHMAYLKIAEGCDRRCTYCIIPKLRGPQRSRPEAELAAEARRLIEGGAKEIVLVAQETTRYGADIGHADGLAGLVRRLAGLSPDVWFRVLYGHPESLDDRFIEAVAAHPNVCPYFDVPIQHASDRVLRRMGRRYGRDDILRMAERIRDRLPEAALRTTIITGFPGETDRDFEVLSDLVETVRFDHLGVFTYSDADDLPSHGLADPVPPATARSRRKRLLERQRAISEALNQRHLDRRFAVLLEEEPEPGLFVGRTAFQAPEVDGITYVRAPAGLAAPGTFVDALIVDTLEYDLIGEWE